MGGRLASEYAAEATQADTETQRMHTIRSFDELCDGKWDHLPEAAFMYVGKIEEAAAKAEKLAA